MSIDSFYRNQRQVTPSADRKYITEYDIEGAEIQTLNQQNPDVIYTQILDLTVAQPVTDPVKVPVSGRAAVIYGYASGSEFDPVANTGVEVSEPAAFVNARINFNRAQNQMHFKHNRGFRGSFNEMYLSWPAQAGIKALLVIFKADAQPWITGESDNRFNSVEASTSAPLLVVSVGNTPSLVVPAKIGRKCATIYNNAATTIYLLGATSTGALAVATNGVPLLQNAAAFWRNTGACYAITAAGTNADIRVLEEA